MAHSKASTRAALTGTFSGNKLVTEGTFSPFRNKIRTFGPLT
jgi:hypothetical protein